MFATPVPPLLSQEQHCFGVSTTHCSLLHQHVHLCNSQDHRSIKWGESEVAQSCPTLCDPVDCSLPGSSVHGILQARILEWVAIGSVLKSRQLTFLCILLWPPVHFALYNLPLILFGISQFLTDRNMLTSIGVTGLMSDGGHSDWSQ